MFRIRVVATVNGFMTVGFSRRGKLISVSAESIFGRPLNKRQKAAVARIATRQAAGAEFANRPYESLGEWALKPERARASTFPVQHHPVASRSEPSSSEEGSF